MNKNILVTGKGLAGYMQTSTGEHLAFAAYLNNVSAPMGDPEAIQKIAGEALLYAVGRQGNVGAMMEAGVIVLMLWLYLTCYLVLLGAEINSVIELAAPHGRAHGQRVAPQTQ